MLRFLFAMLLGTTAPTAHAEPFLMNDVGGTLMLPAGFEMVRWSDWDFKAKGANGTLMYKLWLTPYQAPINEVTGAVFADEYVRKLGNEGGGDGELQRTEIKTLGGRDVVISEIVFKAKGGKVLKVSTSVRPWQVRVRQSTAVSSRQSATRRRRGRRSSQHSRTSSSRRSPSMWSRVR